jgi:hypothetical protein
MVVQATSQLRLLKMGGDVLVRHLLETGLEKVDFLQDALVGKHNRWVERQTSSSLQARPPPVEAAFRHLLTPES